LGDDDCRRVRVCGGDRRGQYRATRRKRSTSFPSDQDPSRAPTTGTEQAQGGCNPPDAICGGLHVWYTRPPYSPSYAASLWRAAPLLIAAPFSAIMIVGALVLVEVTAGITEASMTLTLSSPCTLSSSSTTAIAWLPIRQVQLA